MPRIRLTETNVLRLQCRPKPYRVQDAGSGSVRGLHILIQPTGTRTYRCDTQHGAVKLGRVEDLTLSSARDLALEALRNKAKATSEGVKPLTFDQALTAYTKHQIATHEHVSADKTEKFIRGGCANLLSKNVHEIKTSELVKLLEGKRDAGFPFAANRLHAQVKAFFKYCRKRHHVVTDPMTDVDKPWQPPEEKLVRSRSWYSGDNADALLKCLWQAADQLGGDEGRFTKLMILTGKRRSALEFMRWEQIDATYYWKPTCGNRIKKCNSIPLPKLAQRILGPKQAEGRVFDMLGSAYVLLKLRKLTGVDDLIWHGLRSIMGSRLPKLGVAPHCCRMILDHNAFSDVHEFHYVHDAYLLELTAGLELWSQHVERLVQPEAGVSVLR